MVLKENGQNVKNADRRSSTEQGNTNIIDSFGGAMEKYNKHNILSPGVGGGGGVFPSIGYIIFYNIRYVPHQRVWFLSLFGLI